MRKILNEAGQTLLELIVVVTVSVLVVGALVFATIASLRNASFSKNQAQATKLAQEGIERVRTARDRDKSIIGGFFIGNNNITSWTGNGTACGSNASSIWCNQITGYCGSVSQYCFFKITDQSILNYLGPSSTIPDGAEPQGLFKRAIIISDDVTYLTQKTITAVVSWTDFSGPHESRLTTILRKI